jgi:hypothetical protein
MREGWETFNRALRVLPNAGPNETAVIRDMYAIEGADIVHAENGSSSGITRTALARMRELGALPEDLRRYQNPGDIPTDRRPEVMRAYFDLALRDVGGHAALERISDPAAARALASTIYYQGENGGARAIQSAVRRLGTPEELANDPANQPPGPGSKVRGDERIVGNWTLQAFNSIASDPARRDALLETLSDERIREHERRWGPIERGGHRIVDLFRPPTP